MQRTNRLEGFGAFVDSWRDPAHPQNLTQATPRSTAFGNRNLTGKVGDYRGYALSRWHPRFVDALEVGIRELVLLLVTRFRWVTYSSCEGHHYGHLRHAPVERMVGLCPRSAAEHDTIRLTLNALSRDINRRHRRSCVRLEVISSRLDTGDRGCAVIDLVFRRRPSARWKRYFEQVDTVYQDAIEVLEGLASKDKW